MASEVIIDGVTYVRLSSLKTVEVDGETFVDRGPHSPCTVIDGDGDVWVLCGNGKYRLRSNLAGYRPADVEGGKTLFDIEDMYGIRRGE